MKPWPRPPAPSNGTLFLLLGSSGTTSGPWARWPPPAFWRWGTGSTSVARLPALRRGHESARYRTIQPPGDYPAGMSADLPSGRAQTSTNALNPPQTMRLPSKGVDLGSILAIRGSFMTCSLTRSRCSRESYTIHANTTVSSGSSFTLCGNDVTSPGFTSSATHSMYSSAPYSRQTLPASSAIRRYASRLAFGTGSTKPSTYLPMFDPSLFRLLFVPAPPELYGGGDSRSPLKDERAWPIPTTGAPLADGRPGSSPCWIEFAYRAM